MKPKHPHTRIALLAVHGSVTAHTGSRVPSSLVSHPFARSPIHHHQHQTLPITSFTLPKLGHTLYSIPVSYAFPTNSTMPLQSLASFKIGAMVSLFPLQHAPKSEYSSPTSKSDFCIPCPRSSTPQNWNTTHSPISLIRHNNPPHRLPLQKNLIIATWIPSLSTSQPPSLTMSSCALLTQWSKLFRSFIYPFLFPISNFL